MSRVQSIERAFAVLSALADGPIGVTEVAQRVGVPKSTAARLLTALWHEGAVEQEAGGTRYRLGPRIADLAARHVPTRDLVAVARPHLDELATGSARSPGCPVPDGRSSTTSTRSAPRTRSRSGTGQARGCRCMPCRRARSCSPAWRPPRSIASSRRRSRRSPRPRSWTPRPCATASARCSATGTPGSATSSARGWRRSRPVVDGDGEVLAAVHVHGPSYRFPASGTRERVTERVSALPGGSPRTFGRAPVRPPA